MWKRYARIAHRARTVLRINSTTMNYFIYFECYEIGAHRRTPSTTKTRPNCVEWKRRRRRRRRAEMVFSRFQVRLCPRSANTAHSITFAFLPIYSAFAVSWTSTLLQLLLLLTHFVLIYVSQTQSETINRCPACQNFWKWMLVSRICM